MKRVGYLLNTPEGIQGEPGFFYNYIVAENGLFIRAQGPLLTATVPVASARVRGLAPLKKCAELTYGKIPRRIHDVAQAADGDVGLLELLP